MISNYSSNLFLYFILIFCYHTSSSIKLKYLLAVKHTIIRCSEHEYLYISDWNKFKQLNISCPNQAELFESNYSIYNFQNASYICDKTNKTVLLQSFASILSADDKNEQNFTDDALKGLSSVVSVDNQTYPFEAKRTSQSNKVLVSAVLQSWTSNMKFTHYLMFPIQNTICRFEYNYERVVKNESCSNKNGFSEKLCYSDPFLNSSLQNFNWTRLDDLLSDKSHLLSNWKDNGGYFLDLQAAKTTSAKFQNTTPITMRTTEFLIQEKTFKNDSFPVIRHKQSKTLSTQSTVFVLLFIILLSCIIGTILFFAIRSRQKPEQDDEKSVLDRSNSDESQTTDLDEDEVSQILETEKTSKGGRIINKLNLDEV